ncbi:MAG: DUF1592 domain-containing protein [Myxococcaceae bacterium]|nr:DUF1592 domain-containing protein [Myxococcaceae bacterium]
MRALQTTLLMLCLAGCEARIAGPGGLTEPNKPSLPAFDPALPTRPVLTLPTHPDPMPLPSACAPNPYPGAAPMRRLSHDEYVNSLVDIFDIPSVQTVIRAEAAGFVADPQSLGFNNSAAFLDVKPVLAQQYMDAAEKIAAAAVVELSKLLPCTPVTGQEQVCATQFIQRFGKKLYRHALTADEQALLLAAYNKGKTGYDFKTGIEFVVFAALQSPQFMYRTELDEPGVAAVRIVNPSELASRLSYLLWQSTPDDALLTAAETGQLSTAQDVELQARRMIADPKAQRFFNFISQWLDLEALTNARRDGTLFPSWNAALISALRAENQTFVANVIFQGDGKLATLLGADFTYLNQTLSQHYGFGNVTGGTLQKVTNPVGRRGLLMQGGVLSVHDKENRTSIVRRGLAIRTQLLCQVIPAPPPNIPSLGPVDQTLSQADRLAEHRTNPSCATCHTMMDPLGQVFESIDATGKSRTVDEGGHVVKTAGEVTQTKGINGAVADGADLVSKLSSATEVRECFSLQLYRFSTGRQEVTTDACSREQLNARFAATDADVRELLVGLTQTDDFLFRATTPP